MKGWMIAAVVIVVLGVGGYALVRYLTPPEIATEPTVDELIALAADETADTRDLAGDFKCTVGGVTLTGRFEAFGDEYVKLYVDALEKTANAPAAPASVLQVVKSGKMVYVTRDGAAGTGANTIVRLNVEAAQNLQKKLGGQVIDPALALTLEYRNYLKSRRDDGWKLTLLKSDENLATLELTREIELPQEQGALQAAGTEAVKSAGKDEKKKIKLRLEDQVSMKDGLLRSSKYYEDGQLVSEQGFSNYRFNTLPDQASLRLMELATETTKNCRDLTADYKYIVDSAQMTCSGKLQVLGDDYVRLGAESPPDETMGFFEVVKWPYEEVLTLLHRDAGKAPPTPRAVFQIVKAGPLTYLELRGKANQGQLDVAVKIDVEKLAKMQTEIGEQLVDPDLFAKPDYRNYLKSQQANGWRLKVTKVVGDLATVELTREFAPPTNPEKEPLGPIQRPKKVKQKLEAQISLKDGLLRTIRTYVNGALKYVEKFENYQFNTGLKAEDFVFQTSKSFGQQLEVKDLAEQLQPLMVVMKEKRAKAKEEFAKLKQEHEQKLAREKEKQQGQGGPSAPKP